MVLSKRKRVRLRRLRVKKLQEKSRRAALKNPKKT